MGNNREAFFLQNLPCFAVYTQICQCFVCGALSLGVQRGVPRGIKGWICEVLTDFWGSRETLIRLFTYWMWMFTQTQVATAASSADQWIGKKRIVTLWAPTPTDVGGKKRLPHATSRPSPRLHTATGKKTKKQLKVPPHTALIKTWSPGISRKGGNARGAGRRFPKLAAIQWSGM